MTRDQASPQEGELGEYRPHMSAEHVERLRRWHEAAYEELRSLAGRRLSYLGKQFDVPSGVFPPAPMSELLGRAVLEEVRGTDRVLDMGTGCGVNAVLAASVSPDVVGVDLNPSAVECALANAALNDVSSRTRFLVSDVFDAISSSTFDLVVFDPPFRWFTPRDWLEVAMADEGYRTLTRFMTEVELHLADGGRVLLFFGTSGDVDFLHDLVERCGFHRRVVSSRQLTKEDLTVTYEAYRLTRAERS